MDANNYTVLSARTRTAYVRDCWGEAAWEKIAGWLQDQGWSIDDTADILNSKFMRWAVELTQKHAEEYGNMTLDQFIEFYEDGSGSNVPHEIADMIKQFGREPSITPTLCKPYYVTYRQRNSSAEATASHTVRLRTRKCQLEYVAELQDRFYAHDHGAVRDSNYEIILGCYRE